MAAQSLTKLHVVALFVVYFVTRAAPDSKLVNVTCSQHCHCYNDANHKISAKCDLHGLNSLYLANISMPQDLFSLDLSSSGLNEMPVSFLRKLTNISSLNLANNSLGDTKTDSFSDLKQLRTLDLSFSKMPYLGKGLPRLESLYVEQSHLAHHLNWRDLLSFPSIEIVNDVTWSRSCNQCNITRTSLNPNVTSDPCRDNCSETTMYYSKGGTGEESSGEICWFENVAFPWFAEYYSPSRYLTPGFTLQCLCDPRDCTTHPPLNPVFLLLRLVQRLLDCLYPLASVGLFLNSVVILLVSTSKELCKLPTMFLILNMAVCDFFMGLWCVLTAKFNLFPDNDQQVHALTTILELLADNSSFYSMCPYLVFIFGVVQPTAVMTSLFVTVERYLVIVYSMNPDVRMTKNISAICVCVTWCTAVAYNIYSVFLLSDYHREINVAINLYLCTSSGNNIGVTGSDFGMPMSTLLGGFYILIFLCTIPLYIHIYIVVRKSSTQVGVKREGALARKLALLVLTNLLFSNIPLSLVPLFSNTGNILNWSFSKTLSSLKVTVICSVWVPVFLLCLNTCLNPFLFAFQQRLFKRHFRKAFLTIFHYFHKDHVARADQQLNERRVQNSRNVTETAL